MEAFSSYGSSMGAARILLVDDQPLALETVQQWLRGRGYEVVSTADPIQALEIVRRQPAPDLLLSEIEMPQMPGTELVREASRSAPGIGIVLMSDRHVDLAEAPPGTPLLRKPVSIRDLLATVKAALQRTARARAELHREVERSAELHSKEIATEIQRDNEEIRVRYEQMAGAAPTIQLTVESRLREELMAAQGEWFDAARQFTEYCASLGSGRALALAAQSTTLDRLTITLRASFERYQRALHALTASARGRGEKAGLSGADPGDPRVTDRELDVLQKLADGKTTQEIADELKIAFKTVLTHRSHLLQKFEANNVALLVRKAVLRGYIRP